MQHKRSAWRRFSRIGTSLMVAGTAILSVVGLGALDVAPASAATTSLNVVFAIPVLGGWGQESASMGATAPATATAGSTFTDTVTPTPLPVPTSETFAGETAIVTDFLGLQ